MKVSADCLTVLRQRESCWVFFLFALLVSSGSSHPDSSIFCFSSRSSLRLVNREDDVPKRCSGSKHPRSISWSQLCAAPLTRIVNSHSDCLWAAMGGFSFFFPHIKGVRRRKIIKSEGQDLHMSGIFIKYGIIVRAAFSKYSRSVDFSGK